MAPTKRPAEPWSTPIDSASPSLSPPLEYTIWKPQRSRRYAALAAAFAQPADSVDHILTSPLSPPAQSISPAREATQNSATTLSSSDSTSSESAAPAPAPTPASVLAPVSLQPFQIQAPHRPRQYKTLLYSTSQAGALFPVEVAVHFVNSEEDRNLALFYKIGEEYRPVALQLFDLVKLIPLPPYDFFERTPPPTSPITPPAPQVAPFAPIVPPGMVFSTHQLPAAFGNCFPAAALADASAAPASALAAAANNLAATSALSALAEPYLIPVLPASPTVLVLSLPRVSPPPAPIVGPRRSYRKKRVSIF